MIKLHTIQDIINYQPFCPVCHKSMVVDSNYGVHINKSEFGETEKITLTWRTRQDELVINLCENRIESLVKKVYSSTIYGLPASVVGYDYVPISDGIMYTRLGMFCASCYQYSYVAQILADIAKKEVVDIVLNSEYISVEDEDGLLHEIKNVYPLNTTEYTYFDVNKYCEESESDIEYTGYDKTITIPLVPLDLACPEKTVQRIRNLIVFS